ncbi:hypothetical protein ACFL40_01105 [candidate division KSB1 bacterium]
MNKEKTNFQQSCNISRRKFLGVSALALGAINNLSVDLSTSSFTTEPVSAIDTKLGVKFIFTGTFHKEAYEGPCRWGKLDNLTYEVEMKRIRDGFNKFKMELELIKLTPEINLLEPAVVSTFIGKENPEGKIQNEQLDAFKNDDSKTDLYVVTHMYEGFKVGEYFKKPVIVMLNHARAADMTGALRAKGIQSFIAADFEEAFELIRLFFVKKAFKQTKILCVTDSPQEAPVPIQSSIVDLNSLKELYGMGHMYINYKKFFSTMDKIVKDNTILKMADEITDRLLNNAISCNMTKEDIKNDILFYLTVKNLMAEHSCNAFTICCPELCSSMQPWKRRFTPCLTHSMLKDSGFPSACDRDISTLLAIALKMYLSRKAVYMGNIDIDRKENILSMHHSVASLKMNGIDRLPSNYKIKHFTNSGFGATLRHNFNEDRGKQVTIGRFDPAGKKLLITKGTIVGEKELFNDLGCAQNVDIKITNGRELWRENQNFGPHVTMVFGDYINEIRDLGELMDFKVVNI